MRRDYGRRTLKNCFANFANGFTNEFANGFTNGFMNRYVSLRRLRNASAATWLVSAGRKKLKNVEHEILFIRIYRYINEEICK